MTDRLTPPAPVVAALIRAFPRVVPASANDRHDGLDDGHPVAAPWRDVHPLPVLDPDVGRDEAWRRLRFDVVT